MKVSMGTVEIDDEQRVRLANVLDGKVSKRKANREESRSFIWENGEGWAIALSDQFNELVDGPVFDAEETEETEEDEDLIGDELEDLL